MSATIDNIKNWSDMQLVEDKNDNDGISVAKYNKCCRRVRACKKEVEQRAHKEVECHQAEEQQSVEVERCRAEEQAKKYVTHLWLIMTKLTVVGGEGCYATAWQGQGKGVRDTRLPAVPGPWA